MPNPAPDWRESVALFWAERLGDEFEQDVRGRSWFYPSGTTDTQTPAEYLSDHRTAARAIAHACDQLRDPGITLGFDDASNAERGRMSAIEDAMRTAWTTPAETLRDLAVAMGLDLNQSKNQALP
jgi:hypothetical protein